MGNILTENILNLLQKISFSIFFMPTKNFSMNYVQILCLLVCMGTISGNFYLVKTNTYKKTNLIGHDYDDNNRKGKASSAVDVLNEKQRLKKKNEDKTGRNAILSALLIPKQNKAAKTLKVCSPKSLQNWKRKKGIIEKRVPNRFRSGVKRKKCFKRIAEPVSVTEPPLIMARGNSQEDVPVASWPTAKKRSSSKESYWDDLDKEIQKDKLLSSFPKGSRPSGFNNTFQNAVRKFAEKYLIPETWDNLLARVVFFKDRVNEMLLYYATIRTMLHRNDVPIGITNPLERYDWFFKQVGQDDTSGGDDYDFEAKWVDQDLSRNYNPRSNDPEERKLYYYREDSVYHVFHYILHLVQIAKSCTKNCGWPNVQWPRVNEMFWYAHQQMMRRYAVERFSVGVEPVVPLTLEHLKRPLGLGHKVGPYGWGDVVSRSDSCRLSLKYKVSFNDEKDLGDNFHDIKRQMRYLNYEEFGHELTYDYHNPGHIIIARDCVYIPGENGLMYHTETSARDSIFWRWHTHLEDIMQEFRDTRFERYTTADFSLSKGVKVVDVSTVLGRNILSTDKEIQNILITNWESVDLRHDRRSTIKQTRMSHQNFKYQIHIKNPRSVKKKVIV